MFFLQIINKTFYLFLGVLKMNFVNTKILIIIEFMVFKYLNKNLRLP